jgi:hypothetical protein
MKNSTPNNTNNKRKCNYERVQVTLDICHNKKCDSFVDKGNKLNHYKKELDKINEKISKYNRGDFSNLTDEELNIYHSLCEKKKEKEHIINEISNISELDYLTKTSSILFEYYDIIEKQKNNKKNQVCNILDFFGNGGNLPPSLSPISSNNIFAPNSNNKELIDYSYNRAKLMDEYLSYTDDNFIDNSITTENDICNFCNSSNMNILLHEGIMFCEECNSIEYIITDNDKPSYKEPPKEISYFSYKRINHFNESVLYNQKTQILFSY